MAERWPRCEPFRGFGYDWPGTAWLELIADQTGPPIHGAIARRIEAQSVCSTTGGLFGGQAVLPLLALAVGLPRPRVRHLVARWSRAPLPSADYFDGAAGSVIAWIEIAACAPSLVDPLAVRALHAAVRDELRTLVRRPAGVQLGLAHGVAGLLLAAEAGAAAFGLALPMRERQAIVNVLAASAVELPGTAPALAWPARAGERRLIAHAWCHGAPGIALALLHAWRASGQAAYRELAELALAGTARRLHRREPPTFCCGLAGRIQILVEGYRILGDGVWLGHARELARGLRTPAPGTRFRRTVMRGGPGLAYARLRARSPDRVPLFGVGDLFRS